MENNNLNSNLQNFYKNDGKDHSDEYTPEQRARRKKIAKKLNKIMRNFNCESDKINQLFNIGNRVGPLCCRCKWHN